MNNEIIELTPELAERYLANNFPKNRRIREIVVRKYAADIADGKWNNEVSIIQDPIMFSPKGEMLNGQHRCKAVIRTGKSISVCVLHDVPSSMFRYLDNGTNRCDYDYIDGTSTKNCAYLSKIAFCIEDKGALLTAGMAAKYNDGANGGISPTRQQVIDKYNEDPERILHFVRLGEIGSRYLARKKTDFAAAAFIISYVGRGDVLERFVEDCGRLVPESKVVMACRTYMTKNLTNPNFKSTRKWFSGCIFYTYEAFKENRAITVFNKTDTVYSKYEKYVYDMRKQKKMEA